MRLSPAISRLFSAALPGILLASGCVRVPERKPVASAPPVVAEPVKPSEPPFDPTRLEPMHPRNQDRRIPVLMFHDVVPERGEGSVYFDCTVAELEEMLDALTADGAAFISLEQLHRHLVRGEAVPEGAVVLTFDDNYQGFHDNALPVLRARKIPSAMFVHTDFVGRKDGSRPKMDWDTLRALDQEGLVTIGSHTCSHPEDLASLPIEDQERELRVSKEILERELGHSVPYFAYPVGSGDDRTFAAAERLGYTMAFTMRNGPAEESPSVLRVNRYIHSRWKKAWQDAKDAAVLAPAAVVEQEIRDQPVRLEAGTFDDIRLVMVKGGLPKSVRDIGGGRKGVGEFVALHSGVAGLNGTFFVNAALRGTDNAMIGPFRAGNEGEFFPDRDSSRLDKLLHRPLVAWGSGKIVVGPFQPMALNDEAGVLRLHPGMTDCFLAGAWIVRGGAARKRSEIAPYAARDFNDPRKRAFFGWTKQGEIVFGASRDVITTTMLARGAAAAGVQEAFLMDSGFSTSIVFDGKVLAYGHSAPNLPSRPVPHALVMSGTLAPIAGKDVQELFADAPSAVSQPQAESEPRPRRRRRSEP